MRLFKKKLTPEELGGLIYEALRASMASEGGLSIQRYVDSLDKNMSDLHSQYVGEIMLGCMFGAILAIERSTSKWIAGRVYSGMKSEFFRHLQEQGATPPQITEWDMVILDHFQGYRKSLEGYEGFEPPWKLGRKFYWNVTGVEEYIAMSIKISTLYILEARDIAQKLLNEHGPTLTAAS